MDSEHRSRAPALARAVRILGAIQERGSLSVPELIACTKLPRSSVYVLIDELIRLGLVRQNADGNVQLWMKLIYLGQSAKEALDMRDVVEPPLDSLVSSVECLAVHYGVMDGDRAYYMVKKVSPKAGMQIRSREGMEVSLVHAGLGKCLLAFQPTSLQERIVTFLDYTPSTPTSITSAEALRRELRLIKSRRWAFDDSEGEAEIRCVAVPVFDHREDLLGAVSIVGSRTKFDDAYLPGVITATQACARQITAGIG